MDAVANQSGLMPPQVNFPPQQLADFTHIYVDGILNVTLHTGLKPSLTLHGDPRDLAYVNWQLDNGILRVNLGAGYPKFGPVSVDIKSPHLSSLSYHGSGDVTGKHLRSNMLDLTIQNAGKTYLEGYLNIRTLNVAGTGVTEIKGVNSRQLYLRMAGQARLQLTGEVNLTALDMVGSGWLSIYWLKSRSLVIRSKGSSFIQLAGIADFIDVELWGKARFNGRYLRSTRSFVKTHGHSEADITTIKRQHTLALDSSNIYFYNLPDMKADFMGFSGSVLDMRPWDSKYFEEPTHYNQGPT